MKKLVLAVFLLCYCALGMQAQTNLVKNPSFESYNHCPHYRNEVNYANYWSDIVDTISGNILPLDSFNTATSANCFPIYCNTCDDLGSDPGRYATLPLNYYSHFNHYPHSGNGLMVLRLYYDGSAGTYNDIMYLQGRLYHSLIAGQSYCVNFYVWFPGYSYAINHIGAYLDNGTIDTVSLNNCGVLRTMYTPQIFEDTIITDSIKWTKIEGSFIANGTESIITLGNFYSNSAVSTIYIGPPSGNNSAVYLFDDVSVIATDAVANAGPDRFTNPHSTDSVWVGDTTGYLPCYWYSNGVLIDSNTAGFKVAPDTTTSYVIELNVCGNITYDTVVVWVVPVAVPINKLGSMQVYPNPAKNNITIEGARGCSAIMYDIMGREVLNTTIASTKQLIDISGLVSGVYTLQVVDRDNGYRECRRVVRE